MINLSGFITIDKPINLSSFDIVARVRKLTGIKRVGHTGTLDPFATGVLVVAIDQATKLIRFLNEDRKEYEAEIQLGIETDTLDLTGQVQTESLPPMIPQEQLLEVLKGFTGRYLQEPPQFSAKKINGRSAYKYARSGKQVYIPSCEVEIFNLELITYEFPYIKLGVLCSKGTYIRSLCRDISRRLGTVGILIKLRRLSSGSFNIKSSINFEELSPETIRERLIQSPEALLHIPGLAVEEADIPKLLNGIPPSAEKYQQQGLSDGIFKVHRNGEFLIILRFEKDKGFNFLRVVKFS
ncbi:MAG: tRNA pseudouridine(55) synthase TruB [bacterium]|nr:tRNA pseudouridine(55) synthase TruB [bacterium]